MLSNRTTAVGIFLLAFMALSLLTPQDISNPQVVTRLGLSISIVEFGRIDIDRFAMHTIDKARIGHHYYSDKAPGLSFLAVPIVAVTGLLTNSKARCSAVNTMDEIACYARTTIIAVNGFISAFVTAALFLTAVRLGATRSGALLAAGVLIFATPFFGWSTTFFAHSVSGSLLMLAASGIVFAFMGDKMGTSRCASMLFGVALGMLLGFTIVVDLTAAVVCIFAGALTLALAEHSLAAFVRMGSGLALGGVIGLMPLLVYNYLAFGSPFILGYSYVVGFEGLQHGFFGLTWPRPSVLMELLFGFYRGLLPLSPILILVPVGLYKMWRRPSTRIAAGAILFVLCSFLWINASYYYWDGGASTGPRHLVPILPLSCLALAFAWPHAFWARIIGLVLLATSFLLSLVCAIADMHSPQIFPNPLFDFLLPTFFAADKLLNALPILVVWAAFGLLLCLSSTGSATVSSSCKTRADVKQSR